MTPPEPDRAAVAAAARDAAEHMRLLDTGPMAALRRMEVANPASAFWMIAARHRIMRRDQPRHADWVRILRLLALLMPKGEIPLVTTGPDAGRRIRPRLHNYRRPLGEVFCDGGDPDWTPSDPPTGVISERRLVTLLATRGEARATAMKRAIHMVARDLGMNLNRVDKPQGVDVTQIAEAILRPGDTAPIAEAYFRRLDRAARAQSQESPK